MIMNNYHHYHDEDQLRWVEGRILLMRNHHHQYDGRDDGQDDHFYHSHILMMIMMDRQHIPTKKRMIGMMMIV